MQICHNIILYIIITSLIYHTINVWNIAKPHIGQRFCEIEWVRDSVEYWHNTSGQDELTVTTQGLCSFTRATLKKNTKKMYKKYSP